MAYLPRAVPNAYKKGQAMAVRGDRIRQAREALKAATNGRQGSQTWLAAQIGAHVTSVSDWERSKNQPSPRHLKRLASALGVTVDSLLDEEDSELPLSRDEQRQFFSLLGKALAVR